MEELSAGLPPGVRINPFYDRTRLINAAVGTLRRTLLEEMLATAIAVFLVLRHIRSSIVIIAPLPLAVLAAFISTYYLGIPANIMSLSGIAISIGVLVNAGIVMTENAYTRLHERFGAGSIAGDTRKIVAESCRLVARPIFFSVIIMVVSFFPVFALGGTEGKLFRPLAFTKTFALLGVALLAITLVPALIPLFVRGRLRNERENWVVRSVADVYQPVLRFFLENPKWVALGFAVLAGLGWNLWPKLGHEFMPSLDEGSIMDMPVTVPSVSIAEAASDVVARDALLRSVPEIESVLGKVGRADTVTDPASIDMVETIVNLRPIEEWPRRALPFSVILKATRAALSGTDEAVLHSVAADAAARFDNEMRSLSLRRLHEYEMKLDQPGGRRAKWIDWELQDKAGTMIADSVREAASSHALAAAVTGPWPAPLLVRKTKSDIVAEFDSIVQVPGWANIWTQPMINRVDMLTTGIRTMIGVKVFGNDLTAIQCASNDIAEKLRTVPGATDVFADQIVGKNYLEVIPDRERAARFGISVQSINDTIDAALGGKVVTTTVEARQRIALRVRYARDYIGDEEGVRRILVAGGGSKPVQVPLSQVADVRVAEGPAMIKSENGLFRSYVQLNVRDRDVTGFVEDAARTIKAKVKLPPGVFVEWGGEFENQIRARKTLSAVFPIVIVLIFVILYLTYYDLADTVLIMLAVPGALVGGMVFQVLFGFNFSVAVWVGYIACFGLAAETGIIMLVYLRDAVDQAGGLRDMSSLADLKDSVVKGAVLRLRPKLLTEAAAILGLLPMLWATGVGSEIMRPMAAPVLGGILIADEVIDLGIPVLFYLIRKHRWSRLHLSKAETPRGLMKPGERSHNSEFQ